MNAERPYGFYTDLLSQQGSLKAYELVVGEVLALRAEVYHYRTACASVGETDGHGWAETTKELRAKVEAQKKEISDALDRNNATQAELAQCEKLKERYRIDALVKFDCQVCSGALEAENDRLRERIKKLG
jgi:hypothetical protein